MSLRQFHYLAERIFSEDYFHVTGSTDNGVLGTIAYSLYLTCDSKRYRLLLEQPRFSKWRIFCYEDGANGAFQSEFNITSPQEALELAKQVLEVRRLQNQRTKAANEIQLVPEKPVKPSGPTLTLEQFEAAIRRVFNDVRRSRSTGSETRPAFEADVMLFELMTIELNLWRGRWMAHEPVSNTFAHAESSETSAYDVLAELKTKLMA